MEQLSARIFLISPKCITCKNCDIVPKVKVVVTVSVKIVSSNFVANDRNGMKLDTIVPHIEVMCPGICVFHSNVPVKVCRVSERCSHKMTTIVHCTTGPASMKRHKANVSILPDQYCKAKYGWLFDERSMTCASGNTGDVCSVPVYVIQTMAVMAQHDYTLALDTSLRHYSKDIEKTHTLV